MPQQRGFSEYISLGNNCEVAFQFRRILGRDSSSFFSWNVTPLGIVEQLLTTSFSGIMKDENLSPHDSGALLNDAAYGYKFHSPFLQSFREDPDYQSKYTELLSKSQYLISKFLCERNPAENVAYFYKSDSPDVDTDLKFTARRIRDLLREIQGHQNLTLIILQHKDYAEPDWQIDGIANRYLARIAPWSDATDGHVQSWDRVFNEFPHTEPMRLAGF